MESISRFKKKLGLKNKKGKREEDPFLDCKFFF